MKRIHREGYRYFKPSIDKTVTVEETTFLVPGKRRTPPSKRWYHPKVHMGWEKDMKAEERRELALDAHGGDYLATARALQALANVTRDRETAARAKSDADYFFRMNEKYGGS